MSRRSRHLAWRRNWWLFVTLAVFSAAMIALMGADVVVSYTQSDALAVQTRRLAAERREQVAKDQGLLGRDHTNPIDLFDPAVTHRVSITMDPADYDRMISDYRDALTKSWQVASVEIDGVRLERVGVRLKGNSTLIGLRNTDDNANPLTAVLGKLTPEHPEQIPWLLRFDKFLSEQRYQGVDELAIRPPGGFGADATLLTEYVANRLVQETGQPYLRTTAGTFTLNGSAEGFTLLVEHPGKAWTDRTFPKRGGVLYKAIVGARFRYVGDNPADYVNVFTQKTQKQVFGMKPAIDFLKFVETSTDAEFRRDLDRHLDVDGFTRYLVLQNLMVHPDSLAGTGNNYYLFYDAKDRRMSFVAWDQNLAFGRMGFANTSYRPYFEDRSGIPSNFQDLPGLKDLVQGEGINEENILVTRFFATPAFRARYDATYRRMYRALLASGRAVHLLDELSRSTRRVGVDGGFVDPTRFDADLERNRTFLTDRAEYLRSVAPVGPS